MRIRWPLKGLVLAISCGCTPVSVAAERVDSPLSFFNGRTESHSQVSIVSKKPYASITRGLGRIAADGSLYLVQRVQDEGKKPFQRSWHMWQTAPGHFRGSMSDAV